MTLEENNIFEGIISENINHWILGVCVVNFDIDLGQVIEKSVIAYSAFPDSHSTTVGDTCYYFRFKSSSVNSYIENYQSHKKFPANLQPVDSYCFGYVYFRQHKDISLKRNYLQKSIVILSAYHFRDLFLKVINLIGPLYFKSGEILLQTLILELSKWPKPKTNQTLMLPVVGTVLNLFIPRKLFSYSDIFIAQPNFIETLKVDETAENTIDFELIKYNNIKQNYDIICNVDYPVNNKDEEMDISRTIDHTNDEYLLELLRPIIYQLHNLWEIVITGQPLLVRSHSPKDSSTIVNLLINSIAPLNFTGEYRPFFTIHDSDYKEFTMATSQLKNFPIILGVTNPFFMKSLGHWPNLLIMVKDGLDLDFSKYPTKPTTSFQESRKIGLYSVNKFDLKKIANFNKFLKTLIESKMPQLCLYDRIRDFFNELTRQLICPLENYMKYLLPTSEDISPFKGLPKIRHLLVHEFLDYYTENEVKRNSNYSWLQGNIRRLYERFWSTSHFSNWLGKAEESFQKDINEIFVEKIFRLEMSTYLDENQCTELEMIDIYMHFRNLKNQIESGLYPFFKESHIQKLNLHLNTLISRLPLDLQRSINPQSLTTEFNQNI